MEASGIKAIVQHMEHPLGQARQKQVFCIVCFTQTRMCAPVTPLCQEHQRGDLEKRFHWVRATPNLSALRASGKIRSIQIIHGKHNDSSALVVAWGEGWG